MLFTIACALNQPFGYDDEDINLNQTAANPVSVISDCSRPLLNSVVKADIKGD